MSYCTKQAYNEQAANRYARQLNTTPRSVAILQPAAAKYCTTCQAWHVTRPKLAQPKKWAQTNMNHA